ncbi:hypothetical protein SH2C18_07070 [Clostridium sediminicola]|uniref:DUF3784 domain-containing protein n=1 Tax=Clostridium sediminicola TaxID=3114879 RepID=UPI0031F24A0E
MAIIFSLTAVLFIIVGLLISKYKMYWLISGYNTMSNEKKEKVDIQGLSRFMGKFMYLSGGILFIGVFLSFLGIPFAYEIAIFLMALNIVALLILAQKFDGNNYKEDGKIKTRVKVIIGSIIIFILLIFGSLFYISQESKITLENDRINISGIYGTDIYYKDILNIELSSTRPRITKKINGLNLRNNYKGKFELEDLGRANLFIHSDDSYIYIYLDNGIYIINLSDINETTQLYKLIKTRM